LAQAAKNSPQRGQSPPLRIKVCDAKTLKIDFRVVW